MDTILGKKVRDRITGFTGIVTARVEYLNGCVQLCVKPQELHEGKMPDGEFIDVGQLELVDAGITNRQDSGSVMVANPGGPQSDTPSPNYRVK